MTQLEILRLAYHAQVQNWTRAFHERNDKPENKFRIRREQKAWEKVEEIKEMINKEEQK